MKPRFQLQIFKSQRFKTIYLSVLILHVSLAALSKFGLILTGAWSWRWTLWNTLLITIAIPVFTPIVRKIRQPSDSRPRIATRFIFGTMLAFVVVYTLTTTLMPTFQIEDARAHFSKNNAAFLEAYQLRDRLFKQYPDCAKIQIELTPKLFNHRCDSAIVGLGNVELLLSPEDEDFLQDFMNKNDLKQIVYKLDKTSLYFDWADFVLIRYENSDEEKPGVELENEFYLSEYR